MELKVLLNSALNPHPRLTPGNPNFFSETAKAVRRYQQAMHLHVDGIVGPETWGALLKRATPEAHREARGASNGTASGKKAFSFTHGVVNPKHRNPTDSERKQLLAQQRLAARYIRKAINRLGKLDSSTFKTFQQSFLEDGHNILGDTGKAIILTPAHHQKSDRAKRNFRRMLAAAEGAITLFVFDEPQKTTDGHDVFAYTGYDENGRGLYIAFSRSLHLESVEAVQMDTFIHELAHYAWRAGHAYKLNGRDWETALNGADRYAAFAVLP